MFLISYVSRLGIEHSVGHMSTCTKSTNIYTLLEIYHNSFADMWPDASNHMPGFSLNGHCGSPCKNITICGTFRGLMQAFGAKCGRSLHPAEIRGSQSPSSSITERIFCHDNGNCIPLILFTEERWHLPHLPQTTPQSLLVDAFYTLALFEDFHFIKSGGLLTNLLKWK